MSAKSVLSSLLVNDTQLIALLDGDDTRIIEGWYDGEKDLPQVTLWRQLNSEGYSGDNLVEYLKVPMQIDIWVTYGTSPTAIESRIRKLLKENGLSAIPQTDTPNEKDKVNRASLIVELIERT